MTIKKRKNKEETKFREFHLDSIASNKIYVTFNDNFRNTFFNCFSGVNKITGIKAWRIWSWKNGRRYIPLLTLLKLNDLLNKKKFSIGQLGKNIIGYKGKSSKKILLNLKLPIKEDERLVRIVTHIICDGYDGGKSHLSSYSNTEKALIDEFIKDLKIFGDVPIKLREHNLERGKKLYTIEFPRVFIHILKKIYPIKFDSKNARLPQSFFRLSKPLAFQIIKAFADDESHVGESFITICSSSKDLLKDLKKIITFNLSSHATAIKYDHSSRVYHFELKRGALNSFYQYCNFTHPYKRKLLKFVINRKSDPGNKFKVGDAEIKILKLLSLRPYSAIELSFKLGIKPKNIRYHLYNLQDTDKIIKHQLGHNRNIWEILK